VQGGRNEEIRVCHEGETGVQGGIQEGPRRDLESDDPARSFDLLGKTEVNARWQKAMDKFFVKKDPRTVGADVAEIEEVFHID
jgi:hypothetical protein